MGEKWSEKNQSQRISLTLFFSALSPRNSWTLFFFQTISPQCLGLCFFQSSKTESALDTPSCNFSERCSGYSLREAKGNLYWSCPIQIPSKCWGWINLQVSLLESLSSGKKIRFIKVLYLCVSGGGRGGCPEYPDWGGFQPAGARAGGLNLELASWSCWCLE